MLTCKASGANASPCTRCKTCSALALSSTSHRNKYARLCYAFLCCAMLFYAFLCCAVLCCAVLCYAVPCHVMLHYATLCDAELEQQRHLCPASSAGLGQQGLISSVHGHHLVGGVGPVGAPPANDGALVQAQLVKLNRRPEQHMEQHTCQGH